MEKIWPISDIYSSKINKDDNTQVYILDILKIQSQLCKRLDLLEDAVVDILSLHHPRSKK